MTTATPSMTEQELLNDLLNQEKQMISAYSMGITESSCPNMRSLLSQQYNQVCEDQLKVFQQMNQRGYYQTKDATDQDVNMAKQKFGQMQSAMP